MVFSKRARKCRAMGLHEQMLSGERMFNLMAEEYEYTSSTRPVVVIGRRAVCGFIEKPYRELL